MSHHYWHEAFKDASGEADIATKGDVARLEASTKADIARIEGVIRET